MAQTPGRGRDLVEERAAGRGGELGDHDAVEPVGEVAETLHEVSDLLGAPDPDEDERSGATGLEQLAKLVDQVLLGVLDVAVGDRVLEAEHRAHHAARVGRDQVLLDRGPGGGRVEGRAERNRQQVAIGPAVELLGDPMEEPLHGSIVEELEVTHSPSPFGYSVDAGTPDRGPLRKGYVPPG